MGDTSANEYNRAQKDEKDLFAAIGKKVLGLKLDEEEENPEENEDERVKIVDEIESYCVNCEENVSMKSSKLTEALAEFQRVLLDCSLPRFLSSGKSSFHPSIATIASSRTTRSKLRARSRSRDLNTSLN